MVSDITKYDVLGSRGGRTNLYYGNRLYRKTICFLQSMFHLGTKREKKQLVLAVIDALRLLVGTRFLEAFKGDKSVYTIMDSKRVAYKVAQCFREKHRLERLPVFDPAEDAQNSRDAKRVYTHVLKQLYPEEFAKLSEGNMEESLDKILKKSPTNNGEGKRSIPKTVKGAKRSKSNSTLPTTKSISEVSDDQKPQRMVPDVPSCPDTVMAVPVTSTSPCTEASKPEPPKEISIPISPSSPFVSIPLAVPSTDEVDTSTKRRRLSSDSQNSGHYVSCSSGSEDESGGSDDRQPYVLCSTKRRKRSRSPLNLAPSEGSFMEIEDNGQPALQQASVSPSETNENDDDDGCNESVDNIEDEDVQLSDDDLEPIQIADFDFDNVFDGQDQIFQEGFLADEPSCHGLVDCV